MRTDLKLEHLCIREDLEQEFVYHVLSLMNAGRPRRFRRLCLQLMKQHDLWCPNMEAHALRAQIVSMAFGFQASSIKATCTMRPEVNDWTFGMPSWSRRERVFRSIGAVCSSLFS